MEGAGTYQVTLSRPRDHSQGYSAALTIGSVLRVEDVGLVKH